MITHVNHISFTVQDLDRSVLFYRDVLGLRLVSLADRDQAFSESVTGIPGAVLKIAYLGVSNCALELIQYLASAGKTLDTTTSNVGSAHICFNVDDFHGLMDRLQKASVRFSGNICAVPAGPNKGKAVVYVKDPDGNNLEFISNQGI